MATHTTVSVAEKTWTLLNTGGAATGAVSIFPTNGTVWIKGTATASAPTDLTGAFWLSQTPSAIINTTLAELFPGMAAQHLYAYSDYGTINVAVSCA